MKPETPTLIRLFAAAMFKHWWELMSCAAFTILGVYCAAANRGNGWVVGGSAFLAAAFFLVAAYSTWRDERQRYTDEVARNGRPDIRGEAFNFSGDGVHGDGLYRGHRCAHSGVTFKLFLCNHSPVNTTLKNIEYDGSHLNPPVEFGFDAVDVAFGHEPFPVDTELPHGIGKTLTVRTEATVDGFQIADIPPIAMDDVRVHIVDAFGQRHPIAIRHGERLRFGER